MRKHSKTGTAGVDPRSRFTTAQRQVIERVKKMTAKEGVKTLVSSGIYTAKGKLAQEYKG